MKTIRNLTMAAGLLAAGFLNASAQSVLSREEALQYAFLVVQHEPAASTLPLAVDSDPKRAFGGYEDEYGALVLPETKLSAAAFEAAGGGVIPLGQLWLRKLTPLVSGSPADSGDLRIISIAKDGESHRVPFCLLGAKKSGDGRWELLVFGKGKEPLLRVPMSPKTSDQALPIELSGERESDSGKITFRFVGRFEASISVTELPE